MKKYVLYTVDEFGGTSYVSHDELGYTTESENLEHATLYNSISAAQLARNLEHSYVWTVMEVEVNITKSDHTRSDREIWAIIDNIEHRLDQLENT